MATLAEAAVEIIAELDKFEPDLRRKLTKAVQSAADDAEKGFRKAGDRAGKAFADATAKAAGSTASDPRFQRAGRVAGQQFSDGFATNAARSLTAAQGAFDEAGQRAGQAYGDALDRQAVARSEAAGDRAGNAFGAAAGKSASRSAGRAGGDAGGFFARAFETAAGRAVGTGLLNLFAGGLASVVTAASPLGTILGGVAAAIVAVSGALLQAGGSAISFAGILGSIGLAAVTVKLASAGLDDAFKAQAKALQELATEGKVSEATQKSLAAAMKALAPAARETVTEIFAQAGAFRALRTTLQQNLFEGFAASVRQVATTFLPILTTQLGTTAQLLNRAGRSFADFITGGAQSAQITRIMQGLNGILAALLPSLIPLADGFLTLFEASLPFALQLATALSSLATKFAAFATASVQSGEFAEFMRGAFEAAKLLLGILGSLGGILTTIFAAGSESGVGLLSVLDNLLNSLQTFLESAQGQEALTSFFSLIGTAGSALIGIFTTLQPLIAGIATVFRALEPAIAGLGVALTPVIAQLAVTLGGALTTLAPQLAALVTGLTPLVGAIGSGLVAIFQALLTAVLPLVPIIVQFATALATSLVPVIAQLVPVMLTIVEAFATFVTSLLPLAPSLLALVPPAAALALSFGQLLVAIAPLITLLAQMSAGILTALVPAISFAVTVMAGMTTAVAGFVAGIARGVAAVVDFVSQFLANFQTLRASGAGIITSLVGAILAALSGLVSRGVAAFSSFVSGAGRVLSTLISIAATHARNTVTGYATAIKTGLDRVVGFFRALPGQITGALSGLRGSLASAGSNAMEGLIGGLTGALGRVRAVAGQIAAAITGPVAKFLDIGSPSRVMHDMGDDTVQGFINGIREKVPALRAALTNLARAVPAEVEKAVAKVSTALNSVGEALTSSQRTRLNTLVAAARTGIDVIQAAQKGLDAKLKAGQATLTSLLQKAQQFATSVANTILQTGNITQGTAEGGFGAIVTKLKDAVTNARAFETVLKKLSAAGLNKTLLQQIAEAGPEAGLASGQAILAAGRAGIAQVNKLQAQLQLAANRAATAAAQALFAQGIQVARGIVSGLQSQQRQLNVQMIRLADTFVARVVAALRNVRGIGKLNIPGFADGGLIRRPTIAAFAEDGPEVAIPLNKPRRRDELLEKYFGGWADAKAWQGGAGYGGKTKEIHMPITVTGLSKDETMQVVHGAISQRLGTSVGITTSIGAI